MSTSTGPTSEAGGQLERGGKFLTFYLDVEEYGIEILTVREIIGMMPVTAVPHTPAHVEGVVNLRGQVIPVADLRLKFEMPSIDRTEESCIIVVQAGGSLLGIIVDRVSEVLDINTGEIVDAPSLGTDFNTDYLLGIGKSEDRVRLLLDIDKVFSDDDFSDLTESKAA
jgi:purine-binding chemotaxis protein CheW